MIFVLDLGEVLPLYDLGLGNERILVRPPTHRYDYLSNLKNVISQQPLLYYQCSGKRSSSFVFGSLYSPPPFTSTFFKGFDVLNLFFFFSSYLAPPPPPLPYASQSKSQEEKKRKQKQKRNI